MSLKDGLLEGSPFQQCFIRSTNNLAAGSSGDISGIGGYITFDVRLLVTNKENDKKKVKKCTLFPLLTLTSISSFERPGHTISLVNISQMIIESEYTSDFVSFWISFFHFSFSFPFQN